MPATTVTVTRAEAGQKLLQFLERRTDHGVPRSGIMRWIRTGQVRVDGGRKKPFFRLKEGMQVRIPPYTPGEKREAPIPGGLDVLHEDDDLLVVAKPAGLPVHGGSGHDDSVDHRIRAVFAAADFVPALVHRLDRDTSGLLLAGKTYAEVRRLSDLFATSGVDKIYLCWVRGRFPHHVQRLEDRLEKRADDEGRETVQAGTGKQALAEAMGLFHRPDGTARGTSVASHAGDPHAPASHGQAEGQPQKRAPEGASGRQDHATAKDSQGWSLVAVRLLTGRTHQIRVQLAERGHPLAGDAKYGGRADEAPGLMLHATRLVLPKRALQLPPPWTGQWAVCAEQLNRLFSLFNESADSNSPDS